jgi:Pyridoxamine 5'-phosphate oxidase
MGALIATQQAMSQEVRARLDELLDQHASLELATSTLAGKPWLAAAYFAPLDPFSLVMMLEDGGRTLGNVSDNPQVALMFQTGNPTALFAQAEGVAQVVPEEGAAFADRIVAKTPGCEALVRLPNLVAVRIDVLRYRLTDLPRGWLPAREIAPPEAAAGESLAS